MKLTDDYRELNRQLHETSPEYGTSGKKWAPVVLDLYGKYDCDSVLDYGCGKQTLSKTLPHLLVQDYDPCIQELSAEPEPADLVVCGDVMEHVEEGCVDDVLDHVMGLTNKAALFVIATRPAKKILADGRNAHITIKPVNWWVTRLIRRWNVAVCNASPGEVVFIGTTKEDAPW